MPADYNDKGKAVVICTFYVGSQEHQIQITINGITDRHIKIDKSATHSIAAYGFDENKYPNYPNSPLGLPSKLLPAQGNDKVKLESSLSKAGKAKVFNAVSLSDLTPGHLSYDVQGDELELTDIHAEAQNYFTVHACAPGISLMEVDIYPRKTMIVEIYTLCESDDDVINYCSTNPHLMPGCITPIASATHDCILPGTDLTLDRYLDHAFWRQKDNDLSKPSDILDFSPPAYHELKIHPSYNPATGQYFCNKKPQPANIAPCPDLLTPGELNALQSDLNTIYNQAGILVEVVDKGYKHFNFDNRNPDDNGVDVMEQNYLHWAFVNYQGEFPSKMIKSTNTIIWRVNNIAYSSGTVNGRATEFGLNSAAINVTNGFPTFRTIPHEIGHARYALRHPDDDWIGDGLKGTVNNDRYNIMNSGPLFQTIPIGSLSDFRIRRYQWEKIQTEH